VGRSAEPKGAVAAQSERRQRPQISPKGSECQIQSRAEASLTICEIDSYLPLQGCAGLHLCCQNWGLGAGYLPTPPERGTCVHPRLALSAVCYIEYQASEQTTCFYVYSNYWLSDARWRRRLL